jgi:hypothetical protein
MPTSSIFGAVPDQHTDTSVRASRAMRWQFVVVFTTEDRVDDEGF